MRPQEIIDKCTGLQRNWSMRTKKQAEWYDVISLVDELKQEGMESVTTNDPRTGYNLAKHLLTSMIIAHKIPSEDVPPGDIPALSYIESFVSKRWKEQEHRYRSIGKQSWLGEAVAWLLTTGWYSIFSMVTNKEIWSEVWCPTECFPDFGPDGLVEHAHIYTVSASVANRKIKQMGWTVTRPFTSDTIFYDHWGFDLDGDVTNAVVAGNEFVKEPVKDNNMSKLGRLPIFTSPAGGLPDRGAIKSNKSWQDHCGESIVGTNEDLNLNYNKMRSFYQQAARSAAQHHWLELSQGNTPIATDEVMNRWGSVLHGQPGESVTPIQPPTIPIELTNIMYTYQNELQRGMFPYAVHGNIQQTMSYLAMANIASASLQVLTPYIEAIKGFLTDIDNFWYNMMTMNELHPYKFLIPNEVPEVDFDVSTDVEIPGYLIQRATVSRMMNPDFRLPESWVMERMFPEIASSLKAQADVRKERSMMHPKAIIADSILAYREQAMLLKEANDIDGAKIYEKLAASLEAELSPQQPQQPQPQQSVSVPQEVMPKELLNPLEGLGRA